VKTPWKKKQGPGGQARLVGTKRQKSNFLEKRTEGGKTLRGWGTRNKNENMGIGLGGILLVWVGFLSEGGPGEKKLCGRTKRGVQFCQNGDGRRRKMSSGSGSTNSLVCVFRGGGGMGSSPNV